MDVAYNADGYAYDLDTGNIVNVVYDEQGNAYDAVTNQQIENITAPDNTTTWHVADGASTNWNQIAQQIALQVSRSGTSPYYYPTSTYYPSGGTYGGTYRSPTYGGSGVSASLSPAGAGLNVSPTTLLIIGVVPFAFLFGKGKR